jgi:hypothetical protein
VVVATAKLETVHHYRLYLMVLPTPEAAAAHLQELPLVAVLAPHFLQALVDQELL